MWVRLRLWWMWRTTPGTFFLNDIFKIVII